jgi:type IV pilus assembly protein PilM
MLWSWYKRFFPTSNYLLQPATGIDLSDRSIKYLSLIRENDGLRVGAYGTKKISPGVIDKGILKDKNKLITVLSDLADELERPYVRVSLPEEPAYLFHTEVPVMSDQEIREAVSFQLEKNIPISPAEAIFDFDVVHRNENTLSLQVAVMDESIVYEYVDVLHQAGLAPVAFEIEPQVIARAVIPEGDLATYMIVDFGATRTGLAIVDSGHVLFSTTLEVNGDDITKDIAAAYEISFSQAEKIKKRYGIKEHEKNVKAQPALVKHLEKLADGIESNYQYWQTHNRKDANYDSPEGVIKKVILCGGNANISGIYPFLKERLGLAIVQSNPWGNVYAKGRSKYVPPLSNKKAMTYVGAIGLGLGDYTE